MCFRAAVLSCILALVVAGETEGVAQSQTSSKAKQPECEVTIPNESQNSKSHGGNYGNGKLWTSLNPDGTVVFRPGGPGFLLPDGSLSMKFPWWRGVVGKLRVRGRRLDAAAPPLRSSISEGYGETGFQATALIFPTEGCWEVTGEVGKASLTFVTRVVRILDAK